MSELLKETSLSKGAFYHSYLAGAKHRLDRQSVLAERTTQVNFQTQTDALLLEMSRAFAAFYQQLTS
jgi:hypothetical protein